MIMMMMMMMMMMIYYAIATIWTLLMSRQTDWSIETLSYKKKSNHKMRHSQGNDNDPGF